MRAAEAAGRKIGIKEVGIRSAANNSYYQVNGNPIPENWPEWLKDEEDPDHKYRTHRQPRYGAYDTVADQLGYTQDTETGNWYKKL